MRNAVWWYAERVRVRVQVCVVRANRCVCNPAVCANESGGEGSVCVANRA